MTGYFRSALRNAIAGAALVAVCGGAQADAVADFYSGKTVNLLIGSQPGGGFDIAGRLLARHIGRYIPGEPNVVPQNMQGAGGLRMANFLANAADRQGLSIGMHVRGIIQQPMLGDPAAKFDPLGLSWIGTMSSFKTDAYFMFVRKERGIASVEGMRHASPPVALGSVGGVSTNVIFALLSPELFGFKTRLVKGYAGSTGVMLAVQRRELDGTFIGLSSLGGQDKANLADGTYVPILQLARVDRHPALPNVPTAREIVTEPDDRALLAFAESQFFVALPVSGPPAIPADRTRALREAFMATHRDPTFLAEAERLNVDVSPIGGEEMTKIIAEMAATPPAVIERYKRVIALAEDGK
ncbi:MAG: Bug family tripartite tricarboxylate transporter substrate binding protein [Gemmatimonas sp.]